MGCAQINPKINLKFNFNFFEKIDLLIVQNYFFGLGFESQLGYTHFSYFTIDHFTAGWRALPLFISNATYFRIRSTRPQIPHFLCLCHVGHHDNPKYQIGDKFARVACSIKYPCKSVILRHKDNHYCVYLLIMTVFL